MKKILYISLATVFCLNLFSNQGLTIPLDNKFLSNENGGDKSAIDAYSDGIGIYTVGLEDKKFSAMNELVFIYGEEAKKSGETLKEHVLDNGNNKEQELATLLGTTVSGTAIGTSCDDGNPNTENDVYIDTNGSCQGTEIVVRNSVECEGEAIGSSIIVDGISYLVVDNNSIKNNLNRAETLCTSNVTNMSQMFYNSSFNGNISNWDVSNVTNMNYMFNNTPFNGNVSNWNISKVTEMYGMFGASPFNGDISNWNVSNVTNMGAIFASSQFNGDISNWDVSNVTNMAYMFHSSQFNGDISNWDVSNVTNMIQMFLSSQFNGDISNWNVSKAIDMESMFYSSQFNGDISNWDVSKVTSVNGMFYNSQFNQNISNWNVSNVIYRYNFRVKSPLITSYSPSKNGIVF